MLRRNFVIVSAAALAVPALVRATKRSEQTDIVVIGAGGAGLAAAIAAADLGARVIVLEKMPVVGGNTQLAAGGMNAAGTKAQAAQGLQDNWKIMFDDTMKGGGNRNDPKLVEIMTRGSSAAIDWLTSLGGDFNKLERSGGQTVMRTHQATGGAAFGPYVTNVVYQAARKRSVAIRSRSRVRELIRRPDGAIGGVLVEDARGNAYTIEAKAVVVASGGYGNAPDRLARIRPDLGRFTSTGQPGTTGDALDFVSAAGGDIYDLDLVQIHPTQAYGTKTLISETVRGAGAILVNQQGKRFVNELTTRDKATAAVLQQTGGHAYLVFDGSTRKKMHMFHGYEELGLVREAASLDKLAAVMGAEANLLGQTVADYNRYRAAGKDEAFDRPAMPTGIEGAPYFSIKVRPAIHFTMGGVRIDEKTRVLRNDRSPLPGLYAVGEVASGVHGANRLGGNSMSAAFTFGPIAGREAVDWARSQS